MICCKRDRLKEVAGTDSPLTSTFVTNGGFDWPGKDPNTSNDFTTLRVTYEFGNMVDWEIIAGRDFSRDFATDSSAFIVNEAAIKYLDVEDPVGMVMERGDMKHPIVGVVRNLVTQSPYDNVRQTLFMLSTSAFLNRIVVKLKPNARAHEALSQIETIYKKYDPINPFSYQFVDESFAKKFRSEERIGTLASFFAFLAIFISCLGLFGLAAYMADQRRREIGIRKVLGASVLGLWQMLSRDYIILVSISFLIAAPITYYFMNNFLDNYTYRISLGWSVFIIVGILVFVLTVVTVSWQAIRAALMNPVHAIKQET